MMDKIEFASQLQHRLEEYDTIKIEIFDLNIYSSRFGVRQDCTSIRLNLPQLVDTDPQVYDIAITDPNHLNEDGMPYLVGLIPINHVIKFPLDLSKDCITDWLSMRSIDSSCIQIELYSCLYPSEALTKMLPSKAQILKVPVCFGFVSIPLAGLLNTDSFDCLVTCQLTADNATFTAVRTRMKYLNLSLDNILMHQDEKVKMGTITMRLKLQSSTLQQSLDSLNKSALDTSLAPEPRCDVPVPSPFTEREATISEDLENATQLLSVDHQYILPSRVNDNSSHSYEIQNISHNISHNVSQSDQDELISIGKLDEFSLEENDINLASSPNDLESNIIESLESTDNIPTNNECLSRLDIIDTTMLLEEMPLRISILQFEKSLTDIEIQKQTSVDSVDDTYDDKSETNEINNELMNYSPHGPKESEYASSFPYQPSDLTLANDLKDSTTDGICEHAGMSPSINITEEQYNYKKLDMPDIYPSYEINFTEDVGKYTSVSEGGLSNQNHIFQEGSASSSGDEELLKDFENYDDCLSLCNIEEDFDDSNENIIDALSTTHSVVNDSPLSCEYSDESSEESYELSCDSDASNIVGVYALSNSDDDKDDSLDSVDENLIDSVIQNLNSSVASFYKDELVAILNLTCGSIESNDEVSSDVLKSSGLLVDSATQTMVDDPIIMYDMDVQVDEVLNNSFNSISEKGVEVTSQDIDTQTIAFYVNAFNSCSLNEKETLTSTEEVLRFNNSESPLDEVTHNNHCEETENIFENDIVDESLDVSFNDMLASTLINSRCEPSSEKHSDHILVKEKSLVNDTLSDLHDEIIDSISKSEVVPVVKDDSLIDHNISNSIIYSIEDEQSSFLTDSLSMSRKLSKYVPKDINSAINELRRQALLRDKKPDNKFDITNMKSRWFLKEESLRVSRCMARRFTPE